MRIEKLKAMTSGRLCTINFGATVRAAAYALSHHDFGLVVICSDTGEAIGVLSKSDLVRHLADAGSPEARAETLMSRPFVACRPDDELRSVWQAMTTQALQNVPVIAGIARPIGILDIRDAMKVLLVEEEVEEQLLADYVAGIGYQ